MQQRGINKRRYPRISVDITLEDIYRLDAFVGKERGKILNISIGGIAITAVNSYKLNTELVFTFALPNNMKIKDIHGKIVWLKQDKDEECTYGIQFTKIGIFNKLKLMWFLKTIKKEDIKQ